MPVQVPLRDDAPAYEIRAELNGVEVQLRLRWQARSEEWIASVLDASGALLFGDVALVADFALGARVAAPEWPRGAFVLLDTSGAGEHAARSGLGSRWQLLFWERA
jgi:hypothetical protein